MPGCAEPTLRLTPAGGCRPRPDVSADRRCPVRPVRRRRASSSSPSIAQRRQPLAVHREQHCHDGICHAVLEECLGLSPPTGPRLRGSPVSGNPAGDPRDCPSVLPEEMVIRGLDLLLQGICSHSRLLFWNEGRRQSAAIATERCLTKAELLEVKFCQKKKKRGQQIGLSPIFLISKVCDRCRLTASRPRPVAIFYVDRIFNDIRKTRICQSQQYNGERSVINSTSGSPAISTAPLKIRAPI